MLPSDFLNKGKGSIHVEVCAFNTHKLVDEDLCKLPSKVVLGNTSQIFRSHKIKISSRLIDLAQTNKKKFACSHKTFERVLLANIIHELTYVKDSYERISRKAEFQRISGFINKGSKVRLNQINDANNFKRRSPLMLSIWF